MKAASRLGFPASLDSHNLRNSTSGKILQEIHLEQLRNIDTPSPCGEGVTLCHSCNGTAITDSLEACWRCNGDGIEPTKRTLAYRIQRRRT
jgi:DnaJ-class molecular chaperone